MSASLDSLFAGDRYLVADDGTHCYPILRRGGKGPFYNVVLEDGQRLVDAMSSDHSRPYQWLISPTAVTAVQTQSPDGRENERWALRDINALSAACPAELPADTFDGAHDPRQDMYVRMGLRHDTFVVGDGGKIAGPHEAIRTLVQKAAEGQQVLDELGL